MGVPKGKTMRDKPGDCPECGEKGVVPEVYAGWCKPCRAVVYLHFRHVMNWPLTQEELRRLGYIE